MAYDYEKSKALYEKLDPEQQKTFIEQNKNNANVQRFATEYAAEKSGKTTSTTTASTTPTQTSTSTYSSSTVKPEYQGTGTNKSNTYSNQGEGTYSYNPTSGYYEKQGTAQNDNYSKIRDEWNNLTYAQQQEKLKQNPNLKAGVEKVGGTFKTEETTPTTGDTGTKAETTPKQGEWDYQDDSPERMAQIAQNLLEYKQTMPYLFDDKNAFDNFFINGKGRSAAQIRFLNDYFEANKKYGKYDTYTPEQAGYGIAYGDIPENYLTMLKATDPQRYQEVLLARQDAEDKIKNKSNLNSLISEAGMEDSNVIKWLKKEGFLVDENGDKVDDRLYVAPTEEEQKKVDRRNEILARKQEIKNLERNLLEDLTKQYPGVPRATLMGIVNDRMSDLQREYEDLSCEEAQLTGAIEYDQNERKAQMDAGLQTINNLQKEYGMYYDYTPEGMSALAQAKYAATNVTLDQADKGTDTQKQMALQRVLDDYYAKYGDIIQRSEAQVINDVMALAEQKGISLSQALEENFLKYLRQKPGFEELSTIETKNPEIVKIGDNAYAYWDDGKLVSIGGTLGANGVYQFSDAELRTVGSDGKFTDTVGNDINSIGHILNSEDGLRIGTYTNPKGYTYNVYATREDGIQATENLLRRAYYGMTLGDAAQKWIGQGKDISDAKKVIQSKGLGLNDKLSDANVRKFIEAIGTREGTLKGKSLDEWAKGGKTLGTPKGTEGGQKRNPDLETFLDKWKDAEGDRLKEKDFWAVYGKELEAKGVSKEDFLRQFKEYYSYQSRDAYLEILANLDHLIELTGKDFDRGKRTSALSGLGDAGKVFKYIKNNLTVNGLQEARDRGLKLGVLSDSDVKMIAEASSVLDWDVSQGTWNRALQDFRQSLLSNNPYLKEQYKYQSAYSPNVGFKYNDNDKSFTFGTRKDQSGTQGTTQGTTTQAKSIKNLGK